MEYCLSKQKNVWTVLFSILIAVSLNACSDTNNVSGPQPLSPDAQLSTLTITPGTLQPAFSGDVAIYTVDVATSVTSVTVTAQSQNADASMTINGQATQAGQARTATLGGAGSSTPIHIVVTAVNGSQNTYIVTVNRAAPASDNNLSALSVSGQTLSPSFPASTLDYTVAVATIVQSVTVTATKSDPSAVMSGSVTAGAGQATGQATIPLNGPGSSTSVLITVTAPNGNSKIYTITVNRAAAPVLSGNNNLSGLVVSAGPLVPSFDAATTSYNVQTSFFTADTTVTATVADSTATLKINGKKATSGVASASIPLDFGPNQISIVVTAENGTSNPYIVTVTRSGL